MTAHDLVILLNSCREGTTGYDAEAVVIQLLDVLGKGYGYGRLEQVAHHLWQIQCHGKPEEAANLKRERFHALNWDLPQSFETIVQNYVAPPKEPP